MPPQALIVNRPVEYQWSYQWSSSQVPRVGEIADRRWRRLTVSLGRAYP